MLQTAGKVIEMGYWLILWALDSERPLSALLVSSVALGKLLHFSVLQVPLPSKNNSYNSAQLIGLL